jgi:hypothetical protein
MTGETPSIALHQGRARKGEELLDVGHAATSARDLLLGAPERRIVTRHLALRLELCL